jgi:hypothetical protein
VDHNQLAKIFAQSREDLWAAIVKRLSAKVVLELGVYRGRFAEAILKSSPEIEHYFMLDPWRHLDDWNKPSNHSQQEFDRIYEEALRRTAFARDRTSILRGTTNEVIDQIADGLLDVAYIDGDHTLRGICIDLIRSFPKVKDGGVLGGDDFIPSIWQHSATYEPSLVFPFAVHFAEAMDCPIVALPYNQFAIVKNHLGFRFIDNSGKYATTALRPQARPRLRGRLRDLLILVTHGRLAR